MASNFVTLLPPFACSRILPRFAAEKNKRVGGRTAFGVDHSSKQTSLDMLLLRT